MRAEQAIRLQRPVPSARGFTMVEILAVIAVIAILMSVAAVGIQKMDEGQATTSGLAITEAIFDEARSAAVGRGTRARVLIHNSADPEERDRYLRYMVVSIFQPDETNPETGEWTIENRGTTLPSGVYFDPEASRTTASGIDGLGTYGEESIELPGDRSGTPCIYYEFNSEGICSGPSDAPGAAVVLTAASLDIGTGTLRPKGENRVGFVVWRNGRTSLFRNPDQITSSN